MIITLIIIAYTYTWIGYFKGAADSIQHSEDYRLNGWKAKWNLDEDGEPLLVRGKMVEKFPFSSTILVWITDKWHKANFLQYRLQDAIAWRLVFEITHSSWSFIAFIALPLLRYFGFKITYRK